jgi:hypothetical protein
MLHDAPVAAQIAQRVCRYMVMGPRSRCATHCNELEQSTTTPEPDDMYYDYPIEQLASSSRTRFQLGFARLTMKLLPHFDEVAFEPSAEGLRILASTEMALELPGEVIRQIHANEVQLGQPSVRLLGGDEGREPIMWVRVSLDHADAEPVLQDLVEREARIEEVDWGHPRTVIRALAPLRRLLGYPHALRGLSDAGADLRMWLSHYRAPLRGPDGDAA